MAEIRSLFGDCPQGDEPVQSCVDMLRQLLEQAEAGELVGFTYAGITRQGVGINGMSGLIGSYAMLGALELIKAELTSIILEFDE